MNLSNRLMVSVLGLATLAGTIPLVLFVSRTVSGSEGAYYLEPGDFSGTVVHTTMVSSAFADGSPDRNNGKEIYTDSWVMVDQQGNPTVLVARHYDAAGRIFQATRQEGTAETVYDPSAPGQAGLRCAAAYETKPLANRALPTRINVAEFLAQGYEPRENVPTEVSVERPQTLPTVNHDPIEVLAFPSEGRAMLSVTVPWGDSGHERERTVAYDAESGFQSGWYSFEFDGHASSAAVAYNWNVLLGIETYLYSDAIDFSTVFELAASEVGCQ